MHIIHFERDGDFSLGVATGVGLAFRFADANATGRIELLQEKVGDEWLTVTGPPPFYLQTLIAVRMADEAWKRGEGPAMPTVVIEADPSPESHPALPTISPVHNRKEEEILAPRRA